MSCNKSKETLSAVASYLFLFACLSGNPVHAYSVATYNQLMERYKFQDALNLMEDEPPKRPIDAWRLARAHAALGACDKALAQLDTADRLSQGLKYLRNPEDVESLRSNCVDMVSLQRDTAKPVVSRDPPKAKSSGLDTAVLLNISVVAFLVIGQLYLAMRVRRLTRRGDFKTTEPQQTTSCGDAKPVAYHQSSADGSGRLLQIEEPQVDVLFEEIRPIPPASKKPKSLAARIALKNLGA